MFNEVSLFKFYKGTHGFDVRVPKNYLNHLVNSKESIGPLNGVTLMVVKSFMPANQNSKQESPPVWTQETYWLPRSKYTFCYPDGGVPHCRLRSRQGGTPSQVQTGGYPSLAREPPSKAGWGYPPSKAGWGNPPPPMLDGGTPLSRDGGTNLVWTWAGYPPPPPGVDIQSENITSRLVLRTRSVKIARSLIKNHATHL